MGIQHGQQSAYVQERRKWEMRPVMIDAQWIAPQVIDGVKRPGFMDGTFIQPLARSDGGRAIEGDLPDYPKMLYKAVRADGGPRVDVFESGSGTLIVHSQNEENAERGRGWCVSQEAAIQAIRDEDKMFAELAANRNYTDRNLSERAKAEIQAVEDASSTHVPEIPRTPKRRGRPVKVAEPVKG